MTVLILLASVFFNTLVLVVFKRFALQGVDTYKAIIYNYLVCIVLGITFTGNFPLISVQGEAWLPFALFLGAFFVFGFNVAALTVKYFGLTITSILQRTALVITVIYAVIAFEEALSPLKITAIIFALAAIVLVNMPFRKRGSKPHKGPVWILFLPLLMFLVNGTIDTVLFHIEASRITTTANLTMITNIFTFALITGSVFGYFKYGKKFFKPEMSSVRSGLILGLPNFLSIYFLLRLLGSGWDGSVVVPLNNIGILCMAAVIGIILYKERLTPYKTGGLILAIFSVILFSRVV